MPGIPVSVEDLPPHIRGSDMENKPTGFHLIIPLNNEVSCSSVHASGATAKLLGTLPLTGV